VRRETQNLNFNMKFAIITDIHLGPEGYHNGVLRKINKDVKTLLNNFVHEMNENVNPNFVMVLGDLIEDENPKNDASNVSYIVELFEQLKCPVYYVAGNHDLQNISDAELAALFKIDRLYYSFDQGEYHFVVLFTKSKEHKDAVVSEEQISWLKEDLEKTNKKTMVFTHYTLADQDLTGNHWFEDSPEKCLVPNRNEVRNVLEQSKKVLAVFNGHLHWDNKDTHNNIPYFTIQSLVENEDSQGKPSKTHAIVNVNNSRVDVEIKSINSKEFSHQH
jgi:3',5'-cyclic-AMP phosphodiesterase